MLRVVDTINKEVVKISRSEEFLSLSLSNLVSLISQKGLIHSASLLESCIQWDLADESSHKNEFSSLLCHIHFAECNIVYLKQMLNIYSNTLITDSAMQEKIIYATTESQELSVTPYFND